MKNEMKSAMFHFLTPTVTFIAVSISAFALDPVSIDINTGMQLPPTEKGVATPEMFKQRDASGVPIQSVIGITGVELSKASEGPNTLQVKIMKKADVPLDLQKISIYVVVYVQEQDGTIRPIGSPLTSKWTTLPVDWAGDEPEILEFSVDPPVTEEGSPGPRTYGFSVAAYYKGGLQDMNARPENLIQDYPFPLRFDTQSASQ